MAKSTASTYSRDLFDHPARIFKTTEDVRDRTRIINKSPRAKAYKKIWNYAHPHRRYASKSLGDESLPDLSQENLRIDKLIKSAINPKDEDAVQDAWARILEERAESDEDILRIAHEVARVAKSQAMSEKYGTSSLDKPLNEDVGEFSLHDIIPAPADRTNEEIDHDIQSGEVPYRGKGKRGFSRHILIDEATLSVLKQRYPHDSLHTAIKKLASAPIDDAQPYSLWEDAIVRKMYPWGGVKAVKIYLNRTDKSIYRRAHILKVKHTQRPFDMGNASIKQKVTQQKRTQRHITSIIRDTIRKGIAQRGYCAYCGILSLLDEFEICKKCADDFMKHSERPSTMIYCTCPVCDKPIGYLPQFELRKSLCHYCSTECAKIASRMSPKPQIAITPREMLNQVYSAIYHYSSKPNRTWHKTLDTAREFVYSKEEDE